MGEWAWHWAAQMLCLPGSETWSQADLLRVQPSTGQHARLSTPSDLAREPLQGFAGPQIPAATPPRTAAEPVDQDRALESGHRFQKPHSGAHLLGGHAPHVSDGVPGSESRGQTRVQEQRT